MLNKIKQAIYQIPSVVAFFAIKRKVILPSFTLERALPQNYDIKDFFVFKRELRRNFAAISLLRIKNALVSTERGLVIKFFSIVKESLVDKSMFTWYGPKFIYTIYHKPFKLKNSKYLFAYNHYSDVYGHWLADVLPRLYCIKESLQEYTLLLPAHYTSFQLSTLAPFKITSRNIEYLEVNKNYMVPDLTLVPHIGSSCNAKDEVLQNLRAFYLNYYFEKSWPIASKKIYISRAKQNKRQIINEAEIETLLLAHGFEIIFPENLTFDEQVSIFAACKILVGLTGSGLTNMLFMQTSNSVLEFRLKGDEHNLHYFSMSSAMQLNYFYMQCSADGNDRLTSDFYVDPIILDELLKKSE